MQQINGSGIAVIADGQMMNFHPAFYGCLVDPVVDQDQQTDQKHGDNQHTADFPHGLPVNSLKTPG